MCTTVREALGIQILITLGYPEGETTMRKISFSNSDAPRTSSVELEAVHVLTSVVTSPIIELPFVLI
eukprot:1346054-Amorphochlora_amoeboformis.AAC.1